MIVTERGSLSQHSMYAKKNLGPRLERRDEKLSHRPPPGPLARPHAHSSRLVRAVCGAGPCVPRACARPRKRHEPAGSGLGRGSSRAGLRQPASSGRSSAAHGSQHRALSAMGPRPQPVPPLAGCLRRRAQPQAPGHKPASATEGRAPARVTPVLAAPHTALPSPSPSHAGVPEPTAGGGRWDGAQALSRSRPQPPHYSNLTRTYSNPRFDLGAPCRLRIRAESRSYSNLLGLTRTYFALCRS